MNNKEQKNCLLCSTKVFSIDEFYRISDNFIKTGSIYFPFHEILRETFEFDELNNQIITSVICKRCHSRVLEFHNFKIKCKENIAVQLEGNSANDLNEELQSDAEKYPNNIYTTVQIVYNYIRKYSVQQIQEDESTKQLIIKPRAKLNEDDLVTSSTSINAFQGESHTSIKHESQNGVKVENIEIKIEPLEIKEEGSAGDILGIDLVEFTSQEENTSSSSDNSLSRLPAFCEDRIFDGNRFVSRSEIIQRKSSKEQHKKRARRPDLWAATIQKKLRNLGQQYRSVKGYVVAAKTVGPPCNCKKDCANKINETNRLLNFKQYWQLECTNDKKKFILNHIRLVRPQRALTKNRAFSRIMHHYLDVSNYDGSTEQVKVCKKMFCQTLNISNSVITNAFKIKDNQYLDLDK